MVTEIINNVLEALSSLYSSTNRQTNREASRWLEGFQKKPEAWAVADYLLKSKDSNFETRLFAAQTFKQKITYDLRELDVEARLQLRDSLIEMVWQSSTREKAVMIQLCLAISILAIQLLQWKTVIPDLINKFNKSSTQGLICLLEILKTLPEEMNGNTRLPLTDAEYKSRGEELIDNNAKEVLNLLTMYMQTSGNNTELQEQIFKCLTSWIRTGEIDMRLLSTSPLLELAFKALESPELFDVTVDLVSEIIYETRDVIESRPIIEQIYPYFTVLLSKLTEAIEEENEDDVRGYCRIFVEAGEAYINLIGAHPESFRTLLEGILKCTAYHEDLVDIVPMTFKFWYELTNLLETDTYGHQKPQFLAYYDHLVDIMLGHLQYPDDEGKMTAEERDDFRDFRHKMGDTLKDCCRLLGPQPCLLKPMNRLTALLNDSNATWQQIEAPIFSLRVMGSEIPADEDQVMPHIMEFLSKLPAHPRIRYAATLVISRYSFWTQLHPQFITYQLNFISNGFQNEEVAAASALALKHLCKDCSKHLIDFVPQLHVFYLNVIKTLPFRDVLEVTEAVSYVITELPFTKTEEALRLFCLPIAQELHTLVSKGKEQVTNDECIKIGDFLEQISVFFQIIRPENIPSGQAHPCVTFISELWPVLDIILANFGGLSTISEPLSKCFNSFISSYGIDFVPLLPSLMERIVNAFDRTGLSGYLWVALRMVREYGKREAAASPCFELVQRLSQTMFTKLQSSQVSDIPDVIEDYFRLITAFLDNTPTINDDLLRLLSTVFQAGLVGLTVTEIHALFAVLGFYRRMLSLGATYELIISRLFKEFGQQLVIIMFDGLIDFYHQDVIPDVAALFKSLAELLPNESTTWIMQVVNQVPDDYMTVEIKSDFMTNWTAAIHEQHWIKVRRILSDFIATYRRRNANKVRR
ncbi:armadillo-type protein [Cokeromyces recurvatus]|uniref:armadillo-type protein n=1 Tax=Cokeromyces recurvatus TaxID=90255 RepID=UPI00221F87A0|nr:armadillo-type protein [Cokeromyces recurvatus]KAI7906612.1 armadillo-type protein [Cokeromyces recurvatus]